MTIKHTEGSWFVEKWNHPGHGEVTQVSAFSEDGNRVMRCVVESFNEEADARLIAATPELLEALKNLSELYDTDEGCRNLPEYQAARAAITKATGEAQ